MRSDCDFYLANYFRDQHFVRLQPPIITSADCEGAGEVFTVSSEPSTSSKGEGGDIGKSGNEEFFRNPKFLTVSSQLHLEAFVHEHQKVWTLSPTFRAEKSDTPRHVSEFWMLEVEVRTGSLQEVMDLVEDMIRNVTVSMQKVGFIEELVRANRGGKSGDMNIADFSKLLDQRWQGLIQASWPRVTYEKAINLLQDAVHSKKASFQYEPSWSTGLQLEHEKYIAATVGQGSPVFVMDYPQEIKPFYMLPSLSEAADGSTAHKTVACFDLLLPDVFEVVGGSLREHRLEHLLDSMRDRGLNAASSEHPDDMENSIDTSPSAEKGNLDWYVDLRRYGSVPHGGFGLGFDRLLSYLAGISNIKDVVPWPRYYGRCDC
jgi:asparaginyl-tRNA synthetase